MGSMTLFYALDPYNPRCSQAYPRIIIYSGSKLRHQLKLDIAERFYRSFIF